MTSADKKYRSRTYPQPISGVLNSVIGSLGITKSYQGWLVVTQWPEIVGEHIARISRAFRYEDGTVFVAVDDASWRQTLAMEIENILKKIHERPFGRVIKQVRLVKGQKRKQ